MLEKLRLNLQLFGEGGDGGDGGSASALTGETLGKDNSGEKTYIKDQNGENILDRTGIHPESYNVAIKLLEKLGFTTKDIAGGKLSGISKSVKEEMPSLFFFNALLLFLDVLYVPSALTPLSET